MLSGAVVMLLGITMIRPAASLGIDTDPTEPMATEIAVQATETTKPAATETEPAATETEPAATETVPTETETRPLETVLSTEATEESVPVETQSQETEPLFVVADETAPTDATQLPPDASAQDGDLSVVTGQGITFNLFNYSLDINKTAGNASWRPISSYFVFRNSRMTTGTDVTSVNIPNPNINEAHDQDGFTKYHATVERVLTNGLPVLDLTRNADGTVRTDPGISGSVRSLAYLFSPGDHAVTAYYPRNTILQQNGSHYWYNSASHAVDYDTAANRFRLRGYAERNSTTAGSGAKYGDFLPFTYTGGIQVGSTDAGTAYHVMSDDTDYWFGMTMTVNFFQTKSGKLSDQDMIFSFSGDDDVWVFVDDVLVLDLGGTHGTADGSINFATGEVQQYLSWGGANATEEARTKGSNTSFPTTIRACFDAAGRTPRGGWSADGKTFADFTEHTLKFFYLERGSAVANCKLDFRLPTLPDESLTVTKDITADSDADIRDYLADTLSYRFRVMKADADGNATDVPFITAGMSYDLLESGSKIGTGTVDESGCFSLKAGQSAQFSQMLYKGNGATTYVVEEIMPDELVGQYGGVEYLVSGAGGDTVTEEMEAEAFTAFHAPVLSAEQTQTVTFRNRVDTSKLNTLKVTKRAASGTQIPPDAVFEIQVKLGGNLLPVGTGYTVDGELRTVEKAGILRLCVDETAILEQGILSGTEYEILELNAMESGYRPSYSGTVQPSENMECTPNGATGTFPLAGEVHVTVANADYDFALQIPISKQVLDHQKSDTFRFLIEQVENLDGVWQTVDTLPGTRITVSSSQNTIGTITIGYRSGTEGVFYYRLAEQHGSGAYIYDSSFFIVEVTVAGGAAEVTAIWKNGTVSSDAVAFVNRAVTALTVTKTVTGYTGSMKFPFIATVTLAGEPFELPKPNAGAGYAVNGNQISFSLGAGESVTIPCIPIGAVVTVEERGYDGFLVFNRLENTDENEVSGASREITFSNKTQTLHFRNLSGFRLPNTGGGAILYTVGGAALSLCNGAALLYRRLRKERRKTQPPEV